MKTFIRIFLALAICVSPGLLSSSCNKLPTDSGQGKLVWSFSSSVPTRALALPDTDSFKLKVINSAGDILYEGNYGDSPESLLVNPGTYTVSAVSRVFVKPEFEAPQFGDEQVVVVKAGAVTKAVLECSQLNCGLRLKVDPEFSSTYPEGSLLVSAQEGSLSYGTSEKRTGYFKPGGITVSLMEGGKATRLLTRNLEAREILTLGITCPSNDKPSSTGGELSIVVDTLRTWTEEEYEIGSENGGEAGTCIEKAYGVAQVKDHAGEKGVWVCGYIVGGDLSSSKNGIKFDGPFESLTNIAIAARSSVTEKSSCVSVQLTKGPMRDALNLVDNPGLLGKKVYLRGDIETAYYGIPGIKNLTECRVDL